MIDRDIVCRLFAQYAWAMDGRTFSLLNDVFTKNAIFAVSIAGTHLLTLEGRAATVDFISTTTMEQKDQRRHVITNVWLDTESTAMANLALIVVADGTLTVKTSGVYRVQLGQENGAWRFSRMDLALDLGF